MIIKDYKAYKQSDFKTNLKGICFYATLYSCFHELFDNDKPRFEELMNDIGLIDYNVCLRKLNQELKKHGPYVLLVKDFFKDTCEQFYAYIDNYLNKNISIAICVFYFDNDIGHAVQVIGRDDVYLYYIENGQANEFVRSILTIEYQHVLKEFLINNTEKLITDYKFTNEFLDSIDQVKLLSGVYDRTICEHVVQYCVPYETDSIRKIRKDILLENVYQVLLVYPDDTTLKKLESFSNRLNLIYRKPKIIRSMTEEEVQRRDDKWLTDWRNEQLRKLGSNVTVPYKFKETYNLKPEDAFYPEQHK